jgi:hypothetical protein
VQHKVRRCNSLTSFYDFANIIARSKAITPRKQVFPLSAQLSATLAASSCQDGAASAGAHASTETVGLCTTTVVRLKGALAHFKSP